MNSHNSDHLKDNLHEVSSHLKSAASALGGAVKNAADAATQEFKVGQNKLKSELSDGAHAGRAAASYGGAIAKEQADALLEKSRDLIDSATDLIRERPIASFGVAFAAGWIIAKLARSSDK